MSFTTYEGRYVWNRFPTWVTEPKDTFNWNTDFHGSVFGVQYSESMQVYGRVGLELYYEVASETGRLDIAWFNWFFDEHKGRWKGFWFPSFSPDLVLADDAPTGQNNLLVQSFPDRSELYPETPGTGRYLYVLFKNGTYSVLKVHDYPSATIVTLSAALSSDILMADVNMICFLYYGRFDQDEIEWEYVAGPGAAACTLYFMECPYEYPST